MNGKYIPPLQRIDGFRDDWWNSHSDSHAEYFYELRNERQPVCRAAVSPVDYEIGSRYVPQPHFPSGAARIDLIETRDSYQRNGYASEMVQRLTELHAPRTLAGFSEGADEFWTSIGWKPHYYEDEPGWRTFMTPPLSKRNE